jgi:hypothetical protein
VHRFGATAHAPDFALHVESGDIAPDRCLGRLGQFGYILNRNDGLFLDSAQYDAMAFTFVHWLLLSRLFLICDGVSIINDHNYSYCAAQ